MGQVSDLRLKSTYPFESMQTDLVGPYFLKDYVNQRNTRKCWLLTCIDHFSRYITVTVVEGLNKENIINSLKAHFHRYGKSTRIECDFGTNFVSAKNLLESSGVDAHEKVESSDIKHITQEMQSAGEKLIQRAPRAPFIQGGIERANAMIKHLIPRKRMTIFQLLNFLEYAQHHINKRPIGLNTSMENITPSNIIPVWSNIFPGSLHGCSRAIEDARTEFTQKWRDLYHGCILRQQKWRSSTHNLQRGDIVLIMDLKNQIGYPVCATVDQVEQDTSGQDRYFLLKYKIRSTWHSVKRTAQSLCIVLTKAEQEEGITTDPLIFLQDGDLKSDKDKTVKKLKVTTGDIQNSDIIFDIE